MKNERPNVQVRLARNDEAKVVQDLAACSGFAFDHWEIDWSDIHPHWLLAELDGKAVGTIQVCYGKPIGRLEIMGIPEEIPKKLRVYIIMALVTVGSTILTEYGAQGVSGMIPFSMPAYKRAAKRRGWSTLDSGNIMVKRLR
jgi:hypothetical protein